MKTIKQIADEIGVSKQAVHQKIKKEPLSTNLRSLISTIGNTVYIENVGVELIRAEFSSSVDVKFASTNVNEIDSIVEFLKQQLQEKDKQLAEKDKQITALTETVKTQAESINVDRKNELAETIIDGQQKLIEEKKSKKKVKERFSWIFKRKS